MLACILRNALIFTMLLCTSARNCRVDHVGHLSYLLDVPYDGRETPILVGEEKVKEKVKLPGAMTNLMVL